MASVWFVGFADSRYITPAQWAEIGITGRPESRWDAYNGYSLPRANFTAAQLTSLDASDDFWINAPDGPRAAPIPRPDKVVTESRLFEVLSDLDLSGIPGSGTGTPGGQGPQGIPGREIELRTSGGQLQWRYVGEGSWNNLVALSALTVKGDKGDTGNTGLQGIQGIQGNAGSTGAAGPGVEMQKTSTHLQYRLSTGGPWTNLVALADLIGSQGTQGIQGIQGVKGDTGATGAGTPGKSAYQSWIDAGNNGTEAQFLASLKGVKGDTGNAGSTGAQGASVKGDPGANGTVVAVLAPSDPDPTSGSPSGLYFRRTN